MNTRVVKPSKFPKNILLYGSITGIITGIFLYGFKIIADYVIKGSMNAYGVVRNNPLYLPIFFLGLALIAYIITFFITRFPSVSGGAIPRTAGLVRGILSFKWLETLVFTTISTLFVFLGGFPLGMEGSSVLIGTAISDGISDTLKANPAYRRYILTSGASAGFSFATGSLLAGIVFPLEEMHKKFSWMLVTVALSGAIFSTVVKRLLDFVFNTETIFFEIKTITSLPITYLWLIPIIGIVSGLLVSLFNYLIEVLGDFTNNNLKKMKQFYKVLIALVLIGITGLLVEQNLSNGHHNIIIPLLNNPTLFSLAFLFLLLAVKIFTVLLSSSSSVTGGLFVPVLAIGVIFGAIINLLLIRLGLDEIYGTAIILIVTGAFFATSMDAPITTVLFIVEASLHVETTFYMMIAIFIAMITSHMFHTKPLNEIVLKRMMKQQDKDHIWHMYELKAVINPDSFVVGKTVRDILWPANCLIKELLQEDSNNKTNIMVHGGDRFLSANDNVLFQVQSYDLDATITALSELVGKQEFEIIDQTLLK